VCVCVCVCTCVHMHLCLVRGTHAYVHVFLFACRVMHTHLRLCVEMDTCRVAHAFVPVCLCCLCVVAQAYAHAFLSVCAHTFVSMCVQEPVGTQHKQALIQFPCSLGLLSVATSRAFHVPGLKTHIPQALLKQLCLPSGDNCEQDGVTSFLVEQL
jgi:hypothetical protein